MFRQLSRAKEVRKQEDEQQKLLYEFEVCNEVFVYELVYCLSYCVFF